MFWFAAGATAIYFLYPFMQEEPLTWTALMIIAIGLAIPILAVLNAIFLVPLERVRLLRDGIAVCARAKTIDADLENGLVDIYFDYKTAEGKEFHSSVRLMRTRSRQLGLTTGAIFTVLYLPGKPAHAIPYFELRDVSVAGGGAARITLPQETTP